MRRRVLLVLLLVCIGAKPALAARRRGAKLYPDKETTADMSGKSKIFVGWVDLKEDTWSIYGYSSRDDWATTVAGLNSQFLGLCQTKLVGGQTTDGAKNIGDGNAAGYDLYVKISDVLIDYAHYHLYMSIHFIDPTTNVEIGSIPARPYFGHGFGFANYLRNALDEASQDQGRSHRVTEQKEREIEPSMWGRLAACAAVGYRRCPAPRRQAGRCQSAAD